MESTGAFACLRIWPAWRVLQDILQHNFQQWGELTGDHARGLSLQSAQFVTCTLALMLTAKIGFLFSVTALKKLNGSELAGRDYPMEMPCNFVSPKVNPRYPFVGLSV